MGFFLISYVIFIKRFLPKEDKMKTTTFNKLSPEAQKEIKAKEQRLYEIKIEKLYIDMQLKQLDKFVEKEFWS